MRIKTKTEFIAKISKIKNPKIFVCYNTDTDTHYYFVMKISDRYDNYNKGEYFFTKSIVCNKATGDYEKYRERVKKYIRKIQYWMFEYQRPKAFNNKFY